MLEAIPPDMAVGVMMNTPEDRANEILARTKNSALKERVANRANLHVPSCDVEFPTEEAPRDETSRVDDSETFENRPSTSFSRDKKSTDTVLRTRRAIAGEPYAFKVLAREGAARASRTVARVWRRRCARPRTARAVRGRAASAASRAPCAIWATARTRFLSTPP